MLVNINPESFFLPHGFVSSRVPGCFRMYNLYVVHHGVPEMCSVPVRDFHGTIRYPDQVPDSTESGEVP